MVSNGFKSFPMIMLKPFETHGLEILVQCSSLIHAANVSPDLQRIPLLRKLQSHRRQLQPQISTDAGVFRVLSVLPGQHNLW